MDGALANLEFNGDVYKANLTDDDGFGTQYRRNVNLINGEKSTIQLDVI
jgi:hypothetical protein